MGRVSDDCSESVQPMHFPDIYVVVWLECQPGADIRNQVTGTERRLLPVVDVDTIGRSQRRLALVERRITTRDD